MMNSPDLMILDEPTTGLDPQARHLVWDKLFELKKRGVTQIVTTHYMDEAEQLCDRLAIMDQGQIVENGPPQILVQRHIGREVLEIRVSEKEKAKILSLNTDLVKAHDSYRDLLILYSDDADQVLEVIKNTTINTDYTIVRRSGLEDVFLKLTGRRLNE
jgi:lipooligosaccharide transport system ATP-binding protein